MVADLDPNILQQSASVAYKIEKVDNVSDPDAINRIALLLLLLPWLMHSLS